MREYHKIETLFNRDVEGTKRLIEGSFRDETVEMLAGLDWVWTEKVDGTNIRVFWDGHKVTFGGRTDRAQIPADLVTFLNEKFLGSDVEQLFEQQFGDKEVTLYGEAYMGTLSNVVGAMFGNVKVKGSKGTVVTPTLSRW